jgi:hypothetical protein
VAAGGRQRGRVVSDPTEAILAAVILLALVVGCLVKREPKQQRRRIKAIREQRLMLPGNRWRA